MKTFLFFAAVLALVACDKPKPEIFQWRGENRTGVFPESGLLKEWPENGPEETWFAEGLGNGYGSPTITGSEIFVTGEKDSIAWLFCFDLNGKLRWKNTCGKEWGRHYPGSRSAPTVVGDLVYTSTGMGVLTCSETNTGNQVWQKDYTVDFDGQLPMHGYSEAPVICGDKVFCTPGGKEFNVVALDRLTGEVKWSCPAMGERMGYNPGNLIKLPGREIFVTFSAYHMLGIDAETGELLWTHRQDNTPEEKKEPGIGDTHSNNVIFDGGFIYYAAGDGNRGVKLQLSDDGSKITELWRTEDLDTYMGGIVKMGDFIFGCGTRKKDLKSFHAESGLAADSSRVGTGAVIAADDMLYYYNWSGEISLISHENGKLSEISAFRIRRGSGEHFSHPVIKNGVLYQRRGDTLMAFDIRAKKESRAGI